MAKKSKGFVLMEAIVVISVLCVILVILYGAYSKLLIDVKKKSLYDNTEYIYKTSVIRKYFEEDERDTLKAILESLPTSSNHIYIYCSESLDNKKKCENPTLSGHELFSFMNVRGIYFTEWNPEDANLETLEPTTKRYFKTFDVRNIDDAYRIVVMYTDENEENGTIYQYATLRIGSRG